MQSTGPEMSVFLLGFYQVKVFQQSETLQLFLLVYVLSDKGGKTAAKHRMFLTTFSFALQFYAWHGIWGDGKSQEVLGEDLALNKMFSLQYTHLQYGLRWTGEGRNKEQGRGCLWLWCGLPFMVLRGGPHPKLDRTRGQVIGFDCYLFCSYLNLFFFIQNTVRINNSWIGEKF